MATNISIIIDMEFEDNYLAGDMDLPSIQEIEKRVKKYVQDAFAADTVEVQAANGTLEEAFGIEDDDDD